MNAIRTLPVTLSSLLLGAHFFRAGNYLFVAVALALPLLLLVPRRWAVRTVQLALILGAAEWIHTLLSIYAIRSTLGAPWIRMAAILGGVALFTALSGLVFSNRKLRARYFRDAPA
ncbi:MAG: hypothetical protein WBX15_08105 [Thermoanaerobaculia bacterium]